MFAPRTREPCLSGRKPLSELLFFGDAGILLPPNLPVKDKGVRGGWSTLDAMRRRVDTVEVWGSSPHGPTIFVAMRLMTFS